MKVILPTLLIELDAQWGPIEETTNLENFLSGDF